MGVNNGKLKTIDPLLMPDDIQIGRGYFIALVKLNNKLNTVEICSKS